MINVFYALIYIVKRGYLRVLLMTYNLISCIYIICKVNLMIKHDFGRKGQNGAKKKDFQSLGTKLQI